MINHHARYSEETLLHLPPLVPPGSASRSRTAGLSPSGVPSRTPPAHAGSWRKRNPDYFIARRIQERGALPQPPEPLRLPAPLTRLPWDIAQDEFGVQGADFIGVLEALLLQVMQDQFRAYRLDSKAVADTLPPPGTQDQMETRPQ